MAAQDIVLKFPAKYIEDKATFAIYANLAQKNFTDVVDNKESVASLSAKFPCLQHLIKVDNVESRKLEKDKNEETALQKKEEVDEEKEESTDNNNDVNQQFNFKDEKSGLKYINKLLDNIRNICSHYKHDDVILEDKLLRSKLLYMFEQAWQKFDMKNSGIEQISYCPVSGDKFFIFFICLFLSKQEAYQFLKQLKYFKSSQGNDRNTLEVFTNYCMKYDFEKLNTKDIELYNVISLAHYLSIDPQILKTTNNIEIENDKEEIVYRNRDKFVDFALRYIEDTDRFRDIKVWKYLGKKEDYDKNAENLQTNSTDEKNDSKEKYLIRNKKVYNIDYKLKQILDKEEDIKFYQKPSYYMNKNQIAFSTNEIGSEPEFYIRDTGIVLLLFNFIFSDKKQSFFQAFEGKLSAYIKKIKAFYEDPYSEKSKEIFGQIKSDSTIPKLLKNFMESHYDGKECNITYKNKALIRCQERLKILVKIAANQDNVKKGRKASYITHLLQHFSYSDADHKGRMLQTGDYRTLQRELALSDGKSLGYIFRKLKRNYPGKNHNILLHSIPKSVLKSIDDLYSFVIRWQKTKYESWQFDILSKEDKYLQKIYRYLDLGSNYAEGKQEEYYRAYDEHFFRKYCNEMLQKPIFISDKVIRKIIGDDLKYKDLLETEEKDLSFAFKYKYKASELLSEIEEIKATSKPSKELYDKKNDLIVSWAKDEILAYILKGGLQKYRNLDIELYTKDNNTFKYLANQKVEYSMIGSKNNRIRITDIPLKHFGKIDSYANDKRFKTITSRTYKFKEIDSYITEYEKTRKLLVSGILAFEKKVIDSGADELDDKEGYIKLEDIISHVDSSFLDIKELRNAVFHSEYKSTEILNSNLRRVLELIRKCK